MMRQTSCLNRLARLLLVCAAGIACTAPALADPASTLRDKYSALADRLRQNQFQRPLVLDSAEAQNSLQGDIYAIVDYPFSVVKDGLNSPQHWCEVMILHINTKYCHAAGGAADSIVSINLGKKTYEELGATSRVTFDYRLAASTPEYVEIQLGAKEGPLGTRDYRILLEAVALPNGKTFLHLTYAYAFSFTGRLAMQIYLATIGRGKVGFTSTGSGAADRSGHIGGVRGLVERNTMRYYLAIDAYLASAHVAPPAQLEQRLQSWFTATEQYPQQLHEMERGEYLEMKRAEILRQQSVR